MERTKKLGLRFSGGLMAAALAVAAAHAAGVNHQIAQTYAVEFTVTQSKAVLYSNDKTTVYQQPDINSGVVTVIAKDLPVDVTGITSNGWFQISLNGTYYVPGEGLSSRNAAPNTVVSGSDIKTLTKGTFSFYRNPELSDFDSDDVEDMDENTYIKYLDSFLMGYALLDNCILQDSGKYLKEVYESESKVDKNVAAMTMQAYLINYRNNYLNNSLAGPFRNDRDLKLALNRAIRYNIGKFGAVYSNSSIGSEESKIKKAMENVVNEIKAEQGVSFTCRIEYGDYKLGNGSAGKGWLIEFTKKD
ncbi:MAG: SH3 domain-containing protein [Lachnospiraceae bacterium]|nr:SH3 domain-containing protein [Lachnospiraceae bacterium]MDE7030817.1 SH3 domain-containing protein [Lachnospiraceae bacterium]